MVRQLKKTPLFVSLLVTGIVLTILALAGRSYRYGAYETNLLTEPLLTVVFEGVHDGVWPAGAAGRGVDTVIAAIPESPAESGTVAVLQKNAGTIKRNTAPAKTSGSSSSGSSSKGSAPSEGGQGAVSAAFGSEDAEDAQEDAAGDGAAEDADETGGETSDGLEEEEISMWEPVPEVEEVQPEIFTELPEGVCNPVCPAVDYGIASRSYMAPEGTVFEIATEGIFAPTGEFYYLKHVDDTYFADALFIGDSRTDGLYGYGNMRGVATFLSKESMSIFNIDSKRWNLHKRDGSTVSMSLEEALSQGTYRKVYLSTGINELGVPNTVSYYQRFRDVVAYIRAMQPDAIIYVEGIMHVSAAKSQSSNMFTNSLIVERNTALASLANGYDIFYIDMNPSVCDEEGNVYADLTGDGIHLYASAYERWHQFLKDNAIVRSRDDLGEAAVPQVPENIQNVEADTR